MEQTEVTISFRLDDSGEGMYTDIECSIGHDVDGATLIDAMSNRSIIESAAMLTTTLLNALSEHIAVGASLVSDNGVEGVDFGEVIASCLWAMSPTPFSMRSAMDGASNEVVQTINSLVVKNQLGCDPMEAVEVVKSVLGELGISSDEEAEESRKIH